MLSALYGYLSEVSVLVVTEQAVQGKGEAAEFPSPPRQLRDQGCEVVEGAALAAEMSAESC